MMNNKDIIIQSLRDTGNEWFANIMINNPQNWGVFHTIKTEDKSFIEILDEKGIINSSLFENTKHRLL